MRILNIIIIVLSVCSVNPYFAHANEKIPNELKSLLQPGERLCCFWKADLNMDKRDDYLYIVEIESTGREIDCQDYNRILKIAIRNRSGKLHIAAENSHAVQCPESGGVFGDALTEVKAKKGMFSVSHGHGGNCRSFEYAEFKYSKLDNKWYLGAYSETESYYCETPPKPPKTRSISYKKGINERMDFEDFNYETASKLLNSFIP